MSLDSIVLCPPCLSLSLLFVSTCVYLGEAVVESPDPHSHWRVGRGFTGGGLSRGGGRFAFNLCIYRSSFQRECTSSGGGKPQNEACGWRHGARRLFGWRALCPGRTQLGLPQDELQGFGRTSVGLSDVGQTLICLSEFRLPSEACRCSDRDPAGHDSGSSVVPSSTPGPQAEPTGEKRRGVGGIAGLCNWKCSLFQPAPSAFVASFATRLRLILRRLCGTFAVPWCVFGAPS
jgi:hypothetical protein